MNLILFGPDEQHDASSSSSASSSHATNDDVEYDDAPIDLPQNDERARHILGHLAKVEGDTVHVGFVNESGGYRCMATVHPRRDGGVRLVRLTNTILRPRTDMPRITLLLACPFPSRLRYLWPVISSFVYVTRVIIVKSALSNPEYSNSKVLDPKVYDTLILGGMSQGGRTRPLDVDVCPIDETMDRAWMERCGLVKRRRRRSGGGSTDDDDDDDGDDDDGVARIFLDCGDESVVPPPVRDIVLERCASLMGGDVVRDETRTGAVDDVVPSAIVAIGPERGWTDDEANTFVDECGFMAATLGEGILRVDAAVVAGLAIVSAALDECRCTRSGGADANAGKRRKTGGGR